MGTPQSTRRFPQKGTLLDLYSRTVNAQQPLSGVSAEHFPWCAEHLDAMAALFKAYTARKRALGVLDLDDLLLYWRALAGDEVVGRSMRRGSTTCWSTSTRTSTGCRSRSSRHCAGARCDVTAVGDDCRRSTAVGPRPPSTSWSSRRTSPTRRPSRWSATTARPSRILDVANAVAAQADEAFPKPLRSERTDGEPPELCSAATRRRQAAEVCDRVLEAREQGMELREQAVLSRTVARHRPARAGAHAPRASRT